MDSIINKRWVVNVCAGEKNDYIYIPFFNSQPELQKGKKYLFTHKFNKYIDYIVVECSQYIY